MSFLLKKLGLSIGLLFISLFFLHTVFAEGINLGVSPLIIEKEANPGDTISEKIKVNVGKDSKGMKVETTVKDFYYDENDELQFLTQEEQDDPELKQFALKNWLSVDNEISFGNSSEIDVPITIKVPKDAAPGGRYGMVLFSQGSNHANENGTNVGVGGKVGVMILVTVKGKYSSGGKISGGLTAGRLAEDKKEFEPSKIFFGDSLFKNGPIDFRFRYKNNSATHVVPQGSITVKNIFGGKVGTFNIQGKRVFPGVSRAIYGTLDKDFLFGIYTASLQVVDGDGNTHTSSTFFIGFPLMLITLLLLIVGFIFVFFKYYNKWLINKALKQYGKGGKHQKN